MSKTNATNVEVKYHQSAGVTVCKLTFEIPEVELFLHYDLSDRILKDLGITSRGCHNRIVVTGKAKCNPSDTFDETIGKRIAESRAKIKMFKILERVNAKCADKFAHHQAMCVEKEYNCYDMIQTEKTHLLQLTH